MKAKVFTNVCLILLSLIILLSFSACSEKEEEKVLTPDRDAAETISAALAIHPSGALDQLNDLCEILDVSDTSKVETYFTQKYASRSVTVNKTYDEFTGYWTITVEKVRGDSLSIPFAHSKRIYKMQFLNANGAFQRHYITELDTARTVHFDIKHGEGTFKTRRITQELDSLSGSWIVTNAHKPMVTINGTYYKEATDTIRGWSRVRTSDHELELTFTNIVAPRGYSTSFYHAVSGTITGTFDALVTFISGTAYSETTIHRDINITLGSGRGIINTGTKQFTADLYLGELID
jgi:hypothetical protein